MGIKISFGFTKEKGLCLCQSFDRQQKTGRLLSDERQLVKDRRAA